MLVGNPEEAREGHIWNVKPLIPRCNLQYRDSLWSLVQVILKKEILIDLI